MINNGSIKCQLIKNEKTKKTYPQIDRGRRDDQFALKISFYGLNGVDFKPIYFFGFGLIFGVLLLTGPVWLPLLTGGVY